MKLIQKLLFIIGFTIASATIVVSCASPLRDDETVIFFPTSATQNNKGSWQAPIHHWVFEKEKGSFSRKVTQKFFSGVLEQLGVSEKQAGAKLTQQRVMWFLVDNQRRKVFSISINDTIKELSSSKPNGHAYTDILIAKGKKPGAWIPFKVIDPFQRTFAGEVQLIPNTGLSVISDIDDTIKISNVLDKKELIKNTFVKPYQQTEGFSKYYKKLESEGAFFHYVSASPWQLYPSLKPFMDKAYPKGTLSLRNFRVKDSSLLDFLKPSTEYKIKTITDIINRYPKHQYILIGDSGEHDPEVYAKIYQTFPAKIKLIQIRKIKDSDLTTERYAKTFKDVPVSKWQLISNPLEFEK